MNRKGIVCSECIGGYGPSVTSPKFRCSDCTNSWYGIPLYLLLELVPVTIFYLIVLIFQLNLTAAPMTSFIVYSNIILIALNLNVVNEDQSQAVGTILALFYGIWNLDFFRYAIPPVLCLTQNWRSFTHSTCKVSLPFSLSFWLAITWICIKLHSRDYKIVTWPWQQLNRLIFKHINVTWNSGRTVVDAFATFFLLAFSKVTLMLLLPLYPLRIQNLNNTDISSSVTVHSFTDPSVNFISKEHLPYAAISIAVFLFAVFPPVLLLALYPIQAFRSLLFKCLPKRSIGPLNIFCREILQLLPRWSWWWKGHEEFGLALFYHCSSWLHFVVSWINFFSNCCTSWCGCSLFIANIQPYKKKYMSVIDSLILANMALLSAALDRKRLCFSFLSNYHQIISSYPSTRLVQLCHL